MLLTIEKVMVLRSTTIFSDTPDSILADVAASMVEVQARAGERIIAEGEPGTSLYVIVQGRVKALAGDRLLSTMGDRDVFGELAALDPEPRSATVVAEEDSLLLRLEHEVLQELVANRIEVALGVIRFLCRRVRNTAASAPSAASAPARAGSPEPSAPVPPG